ncbi:anti-sigma factor family protein [Marinobacter salicampi]|uniref:anti-sigma factor family protein n=1 Tax=Marinobacter salicampi TaxID=435907 RepID=UPI001408D838|nr:zf-HC2 domain-containing protein [Marinobacter salicampi]
MMTCHQAQDFIEQYVAAGLAPEKLRALENHTEQCSACALRLHWERQINAELQAYTIPEPSIDFETRVLAAATGKRPVSASSWWAVPVVGGALAASLALGLFLGSGNDGLTQSETEMARTATEGPVQSVAEVEPWGREQTVRLAFNSGSRLDDVNLTIELPANVELANFPGHRQLSWQVDLEPGENVIALPLRIAYPQAGELVAHLDAGDKRKTFHAPIPGIEIKDGEPSS